mmetsp:Transcript_53051/g.164379  ORF Transcript_53051/g.164379 Transcript_53051/m.164379 type:complete len:266 (+) Transcript_53051:84-881(+)
MSGDGSGAMSVQLGSSGGCSGVESMTICVLLALAIGMHCTLPPFLLGVFVLTHPDGPIPLGPGEEALAWQWTIALGVAAVVEFIADKVPYLDHGMHVLMLVGAPAAAVAVVSVVLSPQCAGETLRDVFMVACGALALSTHALRGAARGYGTALHAGVLSPCHSLLEDAAALLLVIAALRYMDTLVEVLAVALVAAEVLLLLWCGFFGIRLCVKKLSPPAPPSQVPAAAPFDMPPPPAHQAFRTAFAAPQPSAPPPSSLDAPLLPA